MHFRSQPDSSSKRKVFQIQYYAAGRDALLLLVGMSTPGNFSSKRCQKSFEMLSNSCKFLPAMARTCNAGLSFALLFFFFLGSADICIAQNIALLSNFTRAFRTTESESESADFSEVRVRKFRTLKTLRTRTQRVCLFTHLYSKEVNISQKISEISFFSFLKSYYSLYKPHAQISTIVKTS
jgi:hypothetical protein